MKVLVVEDEPIIAFDLENLVLDNGFEIAGLARTQVEALALAPKADIALVDIQLADGPTGPKIARELIDRYGIEVIFMTGNPEMVADFSGAVCVVPKPQSLGKIEAALLKSLSIIQGKRRARAS
ncbi:MULTISPECIES: response regulator [Rhizobium]|uniref:Response regulator n=1 Tax=Rhizobium rhododendri TaxID=2506430 RepID=A0ABY8IQ08_9HYPH|nr:MULTISPECIES: response regulator [Rhizobium]MBO9101511.1 response regulator [Rhizobium sp. L58/93]MBO9134828.1 response regulator [Rhizobium sp. B209b/85]MBO9171157.1 response regulator [Rhizobium sp. L245/93]MBO9187504.1 response regulator [Rhizobium sp. E27B/91]MBZ5763213.1 response regulator [Rhizobium sp. VS19-DR96]